MTSCDKRQEYELQDATRFDENRKLFFCMLCHFIVLWFTKLIVPTIENIRISLYWIDLVFVFLFDHTFHSMIQTMKYLEMNVKMSVQDLLDNESK